MYPKCLALFVNDSTRKGSFHLVGVYLNAAPIETIMEVQRDAGMKVENAYLPVKPFENGLECVWDETEAISADDRLPSMVYTVTGLNGQFVREFHAVALPMIGGHDMPFVSFWWEHENMPEWAR